MRRAQRSASRSLRIAQVASLYESVPPQLYGGTERIVSYLTEGLVAAGHEVTLFASGDSRTAAHLHAVIPTALRLDPRGVDRLAPHVRMLARVYRQAAEFDLIHCHTEYLGLPLAHMVATPSVLTLHGRLDLPELKPLYSELDRVPLVSVSAAQQRPLPQANWIATVHHGLPRDALPFSPKAGGALLFLGRIAPEKGPDVAIHVAKRAGVRLRIAAKIDPIDQRYFHDIVEPLLDDPLIEFIGEVDETRKAELLGDALALLFPIDWPEPFGLVMIEALACGTPVISRPCGSVPELLRDGVTALVRESEDELVLAVRHIKEIDRAACRAEFEQRFTADTMVDRYLDVYAAIAARGADAASETESCAPSEFA